MNTQTTTRRNEADELAILILAANFAALEAARDAACDDCGCDCDECEPETWHSRLMGRVDRATSWTWGRGIVITLLALLVFSGGMHLLLTALTGGN